MELSADEARRPKEKTLSPPPHRAGRIIGDTRANQKDTMSDLRIGDTLPIDLLSFRATECLVSTRAPEAEDVCILDAGHTGQHLAAGADMVVRAAWS